MVVEVWAKFWEKFFKLEIWMIDWIRDLNLIWFPLWSVVLASPPYSSNIIIFPQRCLWLATLRGVSPNFCGWHSGHPSKNLVTSTQFSWGSLVVWATICRRDQPLRSSKTVLPPCSISNLRASESLKLLLTMRTLKVATGAAIRGSSSCLSFDTAISINYRMSLELFLKCWSVKDILQLLKKKIDIQKANWHITR